jgi:hypothetical protein
MSSGSWKHFIWQSKMEPELRHTPSKPTCMAIVQLKQPLQLRSLPKHQGDQTVQNGEVILTQQRFFWAN